VLALQRWRARRHSLDLQKLISALGATAPPRQKKKSNEIRALSVADRDRSGPIGFNARSSPTRHFAKAIFVAVVESHRLAPPARRRGQSRLPGRACADSAVPKEATVHRVSVASSGDSARAIEWSSTSSSSVRATSVPLGRPFLDEDRYGEAPLMGSRQADSRVVMGDCRPSRATTTTGDPLPSALAPYYVHIVALPGVEEQADESARVLSDCRCGCSARTIATCGGKRISPMPPTSSDSPRALQSGARRSGRKVDLRVGNRRQRRVDVSPIWPEV